MAYIRTDGGHSADIRNAFARRGAPSRMLVLALALACAGRAEVADPARVAAARVAELETRLAKTPKDAKVAEALVVACMTCARLTGDPAYYKRAGGAAAAMGAADPKGERPHAMRAWVLTGEHRFREAVVEARAALAIKADDTSAAGVLSDSLVELGQYAEAEAALQVWLDRGPSAAAYSRASYLRLLHGELLQAEQLLYQAAKQVDPARDAEMAAWLSVQAGDLDAMQGRGERAQVAYRAALARVPHYANAEAPLARVLARAGQLDEAAVLLGGCLQRRPTAEVAASLEDVERARGKTKEAEQAAGMVETIRVLMTAQGAPADRALARVDADHGRQLERALAYAKAELDARPDVYSEDAVGWVLTRMGRHQEALVHLDRAAALHTPDPLLEAHRGLALAAAGRGAEALELVEGALTRGVALDLCVAEELKACAARLREAPR